MTGPPGGRNRCEHDGARLIVGTLFGHIESLRTEPAHEFFLDLVLSLREHFQLEDVIRICPVCFCVTLPNGDHSLRSSIR